MADLRQQQDGTLVPDSLARPDPGVARDVARRALLEALVAARRSGDRPLANRLLEELVELTTEEQKECGDV